MSAMTDRIEQLKVEIAAIKADPSLNDGTYGLKIKELMKLRRQQVRAGKKKASSNE